MAENKAFGTPEGQKAEIDRLRSVHEHYKLYAPEFDMYLSAFEGGKDFANASNIFKHSRENEQDFVARVERVHYVNYCEPLISFFTNFIFSETIDRNSGSNSDWYNAFAKDVNKKGDNIEAFMRQVCDDMQIFGMSYVLVDAPPTPAQDGGLSAAAEQELKLRPYWVLLKPSEVVDWVVDDFDSFEYLKRVQYLTRVYAGKPRKIERYTEWFIDHITITDVDTTERQPVILSVDTYENTLGFIPIAVCRYKRSKRYPHMGNSFLRDFAYNNREVMNLTSLIQEFLYRQCFNILAVEVDSNIPPAEQEQGVVGTANSVTYPKGAEAPKYITPPVDPAEFLQAERGQIVQEMFKRAAQDTISELFNGDKSSGYSQAQSFSKTVPFIATRADNLERVETALMSLTAKRVSKEWDGKIKYKDRYEITNITDAITQLTSLARDLMLPSKEFFVEELKRLVHEYDGKLSPDVMDKIEKQIEAIDFTEWQEVQKMALVGRGSSPAEQQKPKSTGTISEVKNESNNKPGATKKLKSSGKR